MQKGIFTFILRVIYVENHQELRCQYSDNEILGPESSTMDIMTYPYLQHAHQSSLCMPILDRRDG